MDIRSIGRTSRRALRHNRDWMPSPAVTGRTKHHWLKTLPDFCPSALQPRPAVPTVNTVISCISRVRKTGIFRPFTSQCKTGECHAANERQHARPAFGKSDIPAGRQNSCRNRCSVPRKPVKIHAVRSFHHNARPLAKAVPVIGTCRTSNAFLTRKGVRCLSSWGPSDLDKPTTPLSDNTSSNQLESNRSFIALGSNLGDRVQAIEAACQQLDQDESIRVIATSPLYETKPMYVEEQAPFLNGVCEVDTQLGPFELLDKLQAIESGLGRVKVIDKGPRNIDLDIATYGNKSIKTDRLTIPHALMLEREFVLRPLCDTDGAKFVHPETRRTARDHLRRLPPSPTPMYPLTPLAPTCAPIRSCDPNRQTIVMSILNVTPDSFSDGGANPVTDVSALKATVSAQIAAGATVIDIGGQSSRPSADDVTAEEEMRRILPAIAAIKSLPAAKRIAISIDTYRAPVAEAAIQAGAHIINDISAGSLDPDMLPTVARLGCTYVVMHMRGTPATMQHAAHTSYPAGVIPTVAAELRARLAAAQAAGVRRWRIILDPGIGFAKTAAQNLALLRGFHQLRHAEGLSTYPWLVGSSRKGFIGAVTGVAEPSARVMGTAATVVAAVQGGAEIVRVHDVAEMVQTVKMADALYRA